jgi:hypothetical protein
MTRDPIIALFVVVLRRVMIFLILALLLSLSVWCWVLTSPLDVPVRELLGWLRHAWSPVGDKVPAVLLCGSLVIGTLSMSVIYLLVGKWWKKRASVQHQHRGARLDDGEV